MLNIFTILLILGAIVWLIGNLTINKIIAKQTFLSEKVDRLARRRNGTWWGMGYALYIGVITLYMHVFEPDLVALKGFWLIVYMLLYAVVVFVLARSAIKTQKKLNRAKQEALTDTQDG